MDESVVILSDDDDVHGEKEVIKQDVNVVSSREQQPASSEILIENVVYNENSDRNIPVNRRDDEEQIPSTSTSLDEAYLQDSDSEKILFPEKRPKTAHEIPETRDFSDDYHNESFSQPVPSSHFFNEAPSVAYGIEGSSISPEKNTRRSISLVRCISDGAVMDKKRKKRTREEIEAEQAVKQEAKRKKEQERLEKKKQIELQKQMAKFERDVAAAKKTKCEQNLFCLISLDLIASIGNLDDLVMRVFEERNIRDQVLFEGDGMKVCWKRRILEGEVEDGEFIRGEKLMYEQFCILSVNAQYYSEFRTAEEVANFVEQSLQKYPFPSPRVTVIVYGLLKLRKETVADFVLEVFERYRAQTRFVLTVEEYAVLIARMHRSIARNERHLEEQNQLIVDIEKGIIEGDNSSIVADWWMKMLSQMHRMGADAQRTIATAFPNPHVLLKLLKETPMKDGMKLIADTKMDTGRRIGPVLARKIYLMLTSNSGTEIVDEN